jgi:hypothetical protein
VVAELASLRERQGGGVKRLMTHVFRHFRTASFPMAVTELIMPAFEKQRIVPPDRHSGA